MKKSLYLECYSGISGDMTVAALLDLGADQETLEKVLASLPLPGFEIKVSRVKKSGIDACDFDVILEEDNHDHDMAYLHGHTKEEPEQAHSHVHHTHDHLEYHTSECEVETSVHHYEKDQHLHSHLEPHAPEGASVESRAHTQEEAHHHEHDHHAHAHTDHHHPHVHRGMKEIREIIQTGVMTDRARMLALRIFEVLAEAEAKAHNVPVEEVHFHEVGAVDSIVDIISVAVCLDNLGVEDIIVPVLCEGRGTVRCQHGILPIPVPAVANIISANSLNVQLIQVQGELVTPTGAAIVAAVKTSDKLPEIFAIHKIGIGAGKRQYECPGILRAMLIEEQDEGDTIIKLETNIDDCTGEVLGYVLDKLMKAGARDVHYIPAFMKKNRPAWILNVICKEEDMETLQEIIFRETTTIGIRYTKMQRTILEREQRTVETPLGTAEVKVCTLHGAQHFYPEYESVARLSRANQISYREAYEIIAASCKPEE